jgi:TIR domain-containing protein
VQALTRTLFPCYAPADRAKARELARFLEEGADLRVFLDEGELRPGETLASKARDARTADTVLLLFSRDSWPSRWPRAEWEDAWINEPAAEGVAIGFLRLDDCSPPPILKPRFEWNLDGRRRIKRWLRGHGPESSRPTPDLELLGIAIADRAGLETVASTEDAREFAREFRLDFDAVLELHGGGRSTAALYGDLAAQLELRLEGPLEESERRLREFCEPRRFLFLLTGWADQPEFPVPGGRCSTLVALDAAGLPPADDIRDLQRAFADADSWPERCAQARIGRRLLRDRGRIAELFELMRQWHDFAELQNDRKALDEAARELVWIFEGWGMNEDARLWERRRAAEYDDQMSLFG